MKNSPLCGSKNAASTLRMLLFFIIICAFCVFAALLAANPSGDQLGIFFQKTEDLFADSLNVMNYSRDRNPYFFGLTDPLPEEHAYLPITYLLFFLLERFAEFLSTNTSVTNLMPAMCFVTITFMAFCAILLFVVLLALARKSTVRKKFLFPTVILPLMVSGIFLFSVERGNAMPLAAALTGVFLLGYRSENKALREISFVCLALAASLKAYPALFGILLLCEKRWVQAVRLAVYGAVCAFVPFLFVKGGFSNIPVWLENVKLCNAAYTGRNFPALNRAYIITVIQQKHQIELFPQTLKTFNVTDCLLGVLVLLCVPVLKEDWKKAAAICVAEILVPVNSSVYTGLYFFAPIAMFIAKDEHRISDSLYFAIFVVFLNPLQIFTQQPFSVNVLAECLCVYAIAALIVLEGLYFAFSSITSKRGKTSSSIKKQVLKGSGEIE